MALTDIALRNAKPKDKPYKLSDSGGLHILVSPTGAKLWRLAYRFQGKYKQLAIGAYPVIGLSAARKAATAAKANINAGVDPSAEKRAAKAAKRVASDTFGALAHDWLAKRRKEGLSAQTLTKSEWFVRLLDKDLGNMHAKEIGTAEILTTLRRFAIRDKHHTAKRYRATLSQVFKYGIACGRADRDPAADVTAALTSAPSTPRAAITTTQGLSGLLRAIDGYDGAMEVRLALLILLHVFCRPIELRFMEWEEIDFEKQLWLIPAPKMKMRQPHAVPLSPQAVRLLQELRNLTGRGKYCFPCARSAARPISENTLNAALRRMGFTKEEVCSHGMRSTASTLLNESGQFNPDAIEAQLAHRPRGNAVRGVYMRGEFFEERVAIMNWWSNRLDQLVTTGNYGELQRTIDNYG
jgi:integrase